MECLFARTKKGLIELLTFLIIKFSLFKLSVFKIKDADTKDLSK